MHQCPYITTKSWYKGTVVATSKKIIHKDRMKEHKKSEMRVQSISGHRRSCSFTNCTTALTSIDITWLSSSDGGEIGGRADPSYFLRVDHQKISIL